MKYMRTIFGMMFVSILTISASCGIASDDQRDDPPNTETTAETVTPEGTQLAVPEDLQLISARRTCRSLGGSCIALRICNEINQHHPVPASGCSSAKVCCVAE
jgi:hypothetical protein